MVYWNQGPPPKSKHMTPVCQTMLWVASWAVSSPLLFSYLAGGIRVCTHCGVCGHTSARRVPALCTRLADSEYLWEAPPLVSLFCFGGIRVLNSGPYAHYYLNHSPSPFYFSYFSDRASHFCLDPAMTVILLPIPPP
jgi:hypothetical protein